MFKDIDDSEIFLSNKYCVMYSSDATVENFVWSTDCMLNTRDRVLYDKEREMLAGLSPLEAGGNFVLKFMLDIVMNIDNRILRSLM